MNLAEATRQSFAATTASHFDALHKEIAGTSNSVTAAAQDHTRAAAGSARNSASSRPAPPHRDRARGARAAADRPQLRVSPVLADLQKQVAAMAAAQAQSEDRQLLARQLDRLQRQAKRLTRSMKPTWPVPLCSGSRPASHRIRPHRSAACRAVRSAGGGSAPDTAGARQCGCHCGWQTAPRRPERAHLRRTPGRLDQCHGTLACSLSLLIPAWRAISETRCGTGRHPPAARHRRSRHEEVGVADSLAGARLRRVGQLVSSRRFKSCGTQRRAETARRPASLALAARSWVGRDRWARRYERMGMIGGPSGPVQIPAKGVTIGRRAVEHGDVVMARGVPAQFLQHAVDPGEAAHGPNRPGRTQSAQDAVPDRETVDRPAVSARAFSRNFTASWSRQVLTNGSSCTACRGPVP